jgi:hypothetical protein
MIVSHLFVDHDNQVNRFRRMLPWHSGRRVAVRVNEAITRDWPLVLKLELAA